MALLLEGLSAEQQECVEHQARILQILAGPGSGKTRVLTTRIAYTVLVKKVPPEHIIVVTFSNKAARELRERLDHLLGETSKRLVIGTFHAVALRYLQRYGINIGLPKKITIADHSEGRNIVSKSLKTFRQDDKAGSVDSSDGKKLAPETALAYISKLKLSGITIDQPELVLNHNSCPVLLSPAGRIELLHVFTYYQQYLIKQKLLDFDDLIMDAIRLFNSFPSTCSTIEEVFVDEFQDTSSQQFELMTLLAQAKKCLTVVGDHDQSIYGFRAADIKNFKKLFICYPDCIVLHLGQNYRSSGAIVFAALALIEQDTMRPAKHLETVNDLGPQPTLRHLETAKSEAEWLAIEIQRLLARTHGLVSNNDIAILVRSASLTLPIEQALQRHQLRYSLTNARKFLERPHIKVLIGYLQVVQNEDSLALLNIVNVPSRKFGASSLDKLMSRHNSSGKTLWQTLKSLTNNSAANSKKETKANERLRLFVCLIESARKLLAQASEASMTELLTHITENLKYEDFIKSQYPDDFESRLDDIREFVLTCDTLAVGTNEPEFALVEGVDLNDYEHSSLDRLLSALSLMSDTGTGEAEAENPSITISTIHSAKGLEWPVVFIPGVFQGSIPSSRSGDDEMDEERRLLYVAMTRAKALLYLSYPDKSARFESVQISSFLSTSEMAYLFSERGPKLTAHSLREVASILKRPYEEAIITCVSEDSYEDVHEIYNDQQQSRKLVDGVLSSKRKALVMDSSSDQLRGFKSASSVLECMPMNTLHQVGKSCTSTQLDKSRMLMATHKRGEHRIGIKAFFAPVSTRPQIPSSKQSQPIEMKPGQVAPQELDDYRTILLSSSPDRDVSASEQRDPVTYTTNANTTPRIIEGNLSTSFALAHTTAHHVQVSAASTEHPPRKKRLGMTRPRIIKK